MGRKDNSAKKNETNGSITITVDPDMAARITALFDTRHHQHQTMEDICEAIVRQGTKVLEKRREETKDAQIERAKATLARFGQTTTA